MIFLFSWKYLLALLLTFVCALPLRAQDYPARPVVRLIVPITPGGALDTAARIVVPRFSEASGQPVVIDNRVGVGGVMGTHQAAQVAPDVRERLESQGSEVVGSTPDVFGMWIRNESEKWSRIIRDLQLTLD